MVSVAPRTPFQWAREATKGVVVPATSKITAPFINFRPADEVAEAQYARGLMLASQVDDVVVGRASVFSVPQHPLNYEQFPNWLTMSVAALGSEPTGLGPYVYTFVRDPLSAVLPDSFTIERSLIGGAGIDNEWAYCMLTEFTLRGGLNVPLTIEAEGIARRVQSSTLTAALTMPTPEIPPSVLAKLYIDSTWAGVGTTQVASQVLSWSLKFKTGVRPQWTSDGRTDLDWTLAILDGREVGIEFKATLLVDGQYAIEKPAAEARTLRALQLTLAGSAGRDITIDCLAKHVAGSLFEVDESDGQHIVALDMRQDSDGTNFAQFVVTNNIAALV